MDITLFLVVLFALQLVCLIVGGRASKKVQTQNDYFLASKELKFFPLMMTFMATQVGGGLILGSAEEAYQFGWWVLLYPFGACLGFIVLACGIGRKMAQFKVATVAQLFEIIYQSSLLKRVASFLSIVSLFMILVAQVIASKKFMLSLGVDQTELFVAFWSIVIIYTVIGGLKAVVSIDIIQAAFFIIVFLLGFGYVLYANEFLIDQVMDLGVGEGFDFDASKLTGWLFMPLLFMVIEQDMAQRCFAAQSPRVVSRAALWAAILTLVICIIPIFFGVLANRLGLEVVQGSSVFMTVVQVTTSPTISALIGCAVLMAIISTAISLLNAVSSNLTQDFEFKFLKRFSNIQKSRLMTAFIGIGAFIFSFYFNNIVDLLMQSYELSVCCLFVPVLFGLFNRSGNSVQATLGISFGAFGFFFFRIFPADFPKELLSVLLSGFGYFIGYIWTANSYMSSFVNLQWKQSYRDELK